jgi:hypothetical protein
MLKITLGLMGITCVLYYGEIKAFSKDIGTGLPGGIFSNPNILEGLTIKDIGIFY